MSATKVQVQFVLGKIATVQPGRMFLANQSKTVDFLTSIDFEKSDVEDVIAKLVIPDYSYGPSSNDWSAGGQVWHFGKEIVLSSGLQCRVYIKLNVVLVERQLKHLTCMSFHPPESRMAFPLKNPPTYWGNNEQ